MLTEARENGLVEVSILHPLDRAINLENLLIKKYQLKSVLILKSGNQTQEQMLRSLGRLGAFYLSDKLIDGSTLGISWGTAVFEVAHAFHPRNITDFDVVQVIGSFGYGDPVIDGPEVARHIALTFSGKYYTLNAPVIVQDKNTRNRLLKERNIREVLTKASRARAILVGIGSSDPGRSGIVRAGYLQEEEMKSINESSGAVGDICCWLFDQEGVYKNIEFNRRVVGVSLDALKKSQAEVVGVAGGREKAEAILGALRGKLIDTLITDDKAAADLLKLDQN
jgi:DNA-binding transcriptional regulator LsrR (DeoR family)